MSKLIVEMEKVPKNCDDGCWGYLSGECPWSDHVDGYTMNGGRPRNCPIKSVLPEEHGDLIDRDVMQEKAFQMNFHGRISERELFLFNRSLSEMPIVIAAERKDDGK